MKTTELTEVFLWLSGTGFSEFSNPDENMVSVWYESLKDIPDGYAIRGAKAYTREPHPYQRFPYPANIRECAKEVYMRDVNKIKEDYRRHCECYDRAVALYPGAYFEDQAQCKAAFTNATIRISPEEVVDLIHGFITGAEFDGTINEIPTFKEYLEMLDGHEG